MQSNRAQHCKASSFKNMDTTQKLKTIQTFLANEIRLDEADHSMKSTQKTIPINQITHSVVQFLHVL